MTKSCHPTLEAPCLECIDSNQLRDSTDQGVRESRELVILLHAFYREKNLGLALTGTLAEKMPDGIFDGSKGKFCLFHAFRFTGSVLYAKSDCDKDDICEILHLGARALKQIRGNKIFHLKGNSFGTFGLEKYPKILSFLTKFSVLSSDKTANVYL